MMPRISRLVTGLVLAVGVASGLAQDEAEVEARASANRWLALQDGHQYDETWKQADELLRAAVSQDEWSRKWSVTRGPLGQVKSRGVRSAEYTTAMPGAPEGEDVVAEFDTVFENDQTAVENMVMKKQSDGSWRVAGYRIR